MNLTVSIPTIESLNIHTHSDANNFVIEVGEKRTSISNISTGKTAMLKLPEMTFTNEICHWLIENQWEIKSDPEMIQRELAYYIKG